MYVGPMLICRYRLHHKREDTEVAQQSEPGGSCGQAEGLQRETPRSWLSSTLVWKTYGDEDVVAASEDEGVDDSTPGDGTGNDLPDPMDGKQHDERPTGLTSSQLDDASKGNENGDGMSSLRPTGKRQPPADLCDYLRTVRETAH